MTTLKAPTVTVTDPRPSDDRRTIIFSDAEENYRPDYLWWPGSDVPEDHGYTVARIALHATPFRLGEWLGDTTWATTYRLNGGWEDTPEEWELGRSTYKDINFRFTHLVEPVVTLRAIVIPDDATAIGGEFRTGNPETGEWLSSNNPSDCRVLDDLFTRDHWVETICRQRSA